jgi:hypothetical protein
MAVTNKVVYDAVTARLAAQAADQASLTGRAQSLLAAATIAATIVGALSNGNVLNVKTTATRFPIWLLVIGGAGFLLVIVPAIWALVPRRWSFSPDPEALQANIAAAPGDAEDDDAYLSLVNGFTTPERPGGRSPLAQNADELARLRWLVTVETIGLAVVVAFGFANVVYLSINA